MAKYAGSISSVRKKVTYTHELISGAYHESGHTIYGLLHFMMIYSVKVFPDKKTNRIQGLTHYDSFFDLDQLNDKILLNERLNSEIGLCYAGLVAEKYQYKLHSGSDKFPSFLDGSSNDLQEASVLIKKFELAPPGSKRYNYKKRMIRKVAKELQEHWEAVTVVAHALFQKKRLNFEALKNLLTKKTQNKEFWKERFKIIEKFCNDSILDENDFKNYIYL